MLRQSFMRTQISNQDCKFASGYVILISSSTFWYVWFQEHLSQHHEEKKKTTIELLGWVVLRATSNVFVLTVIAAAAYLIFYLYEEANIDVSIVCNVIPSCWETLFCFKIKNRIINKIGHFQYNILYNLICCHKNLCKWSLIN